MRRWRKRRKLYSRSAPLHGVVFELITMFFTGNNTTALANPINQVLSLLGASMVGN
jgi:hypothetical protein